MKEPTERQVKWLDFWIAVCIIGLKMEEYIDKPTTY